jgi:hypothetical protein
MVQENKEVFLIEKLQPTILENTFYNKIYQTLYLFSLASIGWLIGSIININIFDFWLFNDQNLAVMFAIMSGGLSQDINLFQSFNWSTEKFKNGLIIDIIIGVSSSIFFGTITGLIKDINTGIFFAFGGGLSAVAVKFEGGFDSVEIQETVLPNHGIWQSVRNFRNFIFILGLPVFLMAILVNIYYYGFNFISLAISLIVFYLNGLGVGIISGLSFGGASCIKHFVLRSLLCLRGYIPWNYARFLDYATKMIFLNKVGGGYVFIHRLLMEHFANMEIQNKAK